MKASLLAVFLSTTDASRSTSSSSFELYANVHRRSYEHGSEEHKLRRELYGKRLHEVAAHNGQPHRLWTAGMNKFSDRTENELQAFRGWDGSARPDARGHATRLHIALLQEEGDDDEELPVEKLWTGLNASRHIRNQGDCGSCWAVTTATVLEAHAEISGQARTFSAQQIVECTPNPQHCGGDGGCQGATAELAMEWVLQNGVAEESGIPYTGQDAPCPSLSPKLAMSQLFDQPNSGAAFGMIGWETLPKNEYEPLARALAQRGPVAVSASADAWFNYAAGIFNACGKDAVVDHSVTAIGYGQDKGVKYWTIQNSWGSDWGELGLIRLERHSDGQYCGTNNDPQKGIACRGEISPVPVCGMCGVLFDSVVPHFQPRK